MGEGVEEEVLLALVFLGMMLRKGQDKKKRTKKKTRKTKARLQVSTKKNIEKPRADYKLSFSNAS